jgi:hypothetical protein
MITEDWDLVAREFQDQITARSLLTLARQLRVTIPSLRALGVGWSQADSAWTFP